jgi:3-deoxy-manno-octulosonate cytidylyltransferase (CMP-KDO synthetase)
MIEHVYRRAASATGVDAVVVATDDARIAMTVEAFGGIVRMTRSIHRTGTDRIAEVAAELQCEIIVNVQGDEPLIEPAAITQVIAPLLSDPRLQMSTLRRVISDPADYGNPHVVKVVADRNGRALYFSRASIPSIRGSIFETTGVHRPAHKHVGLYGYRRDFVILFAGLPQTELEIAESLEQLRALEHGYDILALETQYDSVGVDTPDDLERVRRQIVAVPTRA